jgi:Fic family protein
VEPIVRDFALASRIAAAESRTTAQRLTEIPLEWADAVGRVRAGSAAAKLLAILPARPVVTADDVAAATGAPLSSVYAAIERLDTAGVLRPLTNRKRDQIWGATLILEELDELGARIARAWG